MPRILTYNVHSCRGTDGKLDVGRIADVIAEARPDIVALQEVDVRRARTSKVDQAHAIAERLGMAFHFNAALNVAEEQYGDAILTTLPVALIKTGPLPTLPRMRGLERRGALWVEVEVEGGRKVQIVNTHLGLVPAEQRPQARHLLGGEWLGHPRCADPTILVGDFNATPPLRRLQDVRWPPSRCTSGGGCKAGGADLSLASADDPDRPHLRQRFSDRFGHARSKR